MIDVNKPVINPELVKAINEMNENNTREAQANVIDEVMKAHFLSPVNISPSPKASPDNNETIIKQNTTIDFIIIENTANQKFFLAFTDWTELSKWRKSENQQTLILTFDDLSAMVLDKRGTSDGFVINPYGGNVVFTNSMIKSLKEESERMANGGAVSYTVQEDTTVQLGQPKDYPCEMVKAISHHLKHVYSVNAAYLQLMNKGGELSYLLIIDFTGDRRKTFNGIANAAVSHSNGMFIDMVPLDSEFGQNAVKDIEPFYKRS